MEGNVFDVFRVLSLVVVWAIPAVLVLAVVAFIILAPAATLAGAVIRLYEAISDKLRGKAQAERQLLAKTQSLNLVCSTDVDCPPRFVCMNGYCVPEKKLVRTKS